MRSEREGLGSYSVCFRAFRLILLLEMFLDIHMSAADQISYFFKIPS